MRFSSVLCAAALVVCSGTVLATDSQIALNYNFNGMVHAGESGSPDSMGPSGYRSIADRGFIIDGTLTAPVALGANPIVGATGITYGIVTTPFALDMVMLGNRNLNAAWDLTVDGDNRGLMPDWLPSDDLRVPQVTTLATPIALDAYSEIGLLYHITNVGTSSSSFVVTLGFSDSTSINVTVTGRDWFGTRTVLAPGANSGLSVQQTMGNFRAADNGDSGTLPATPASNVLNVWEAVIDARKLKAAGLGDVNGKTLTTITYTYPSPVPTGNRNYGIYATTVRTGGAHPANDTCGTATQVGGGVFTGNTLRATPSAVSGCGTNDDAAVWYRYTASAAGTVEARTCGSALDTTLAVYTECGGASVACGNAECGDDAVVSWAATAGQSYLIRVAGNNYANGQFVLAINDAPAVYQPLALSYNFNGMVHGAAEQGTANLNNLDGYRAIADRGLNLTGAGNALNAAPVVDTDGMPFSLVGEAGALDIVHLGNRNLVANAARVYGTGTTQGPQPNWQPNVDQTGPQTTTLGAGYVLTPSSRLGVIYQVSDSGGRFDTVLGFSDNTSVTVTMKAPDWFGNQTPPAVTAGSGLVFQRQLGVYAGTQNADLADTTTNNLNVAEAVTSVAQLANDNLGNHAGKTVTSITFQNPISNANYVNSTPATGSGFAIIAATLRDVHPPAPACPADIGVQGGTQGQDGILDNNDFVVFIDLFFGHDPLADRGVQGGLPGSDGSWDNNDFVVFIDQFFAGCGG